jgi:hypothetical protein
LRGNHSDTMDRPALTDNWSPVKQIEADGDAYSAFPEVRKSSIVERNQSIWSQVVGQLFARKQFINCEDISRYLVEFDV